MYSLWFLAVRPPASVCPSVWRRHGFRSVTRVVHFKCHVHVMNRLWAEAYWFSTMSLSKCPPSGHIWFPGSRTLTLGLGRSPPNFSGTLLLCMDKVYRFSVISLSKWPPGSHIGFFDWFLDSNFNLALTINSRLSSTLHIDFEWCQIQYGCLETILDFILLDITLVLLCISTRTSVTHYMCLWINPFDFFSDVLFKISTRWPYWIFWFSDSSYSLASDINS